MAVTQWVAWARRIASLAQNGLTYSEGVFDRQRYEELRGIAAEMLAPGAEVPVEQMLRALAQERGYATPKVDVRGVVFRRPYRGRCTRCSFCVRLAEARPAAAWRRARRHSSLKTSCRHSRKAA